MAEWLDAVAEWPSQHSRGALQIESNPELAQHGQRDAKRGPTRSAYWLPAGRLQDRPDPSSRPPPRGPAKLHPYSVHLILASACATQRKIYATVPPAGRIPCARSSSHFGRSHGRSRGQDYQRLEPGRRRQAEAQQGPAPREGRRGGGGLTRVLIEVGSGSASEQHAPYDYQPSPCRGHVMPWPDPSMPRTRHMGLIRKKTPACSPRGP